MNKHAALSLSVLVCLTAAARPEGPQLPDFRSTRTEAPLVLTPGAKDDPQMYVRLPAELCPQGRADARNDRGAILVAGVALTLALSLVGLWLVCGGRRRVLGGAALALTVLLVAGVCGCPPRGLDSRFEYYTEQLARATHEADGSLKGEALLQVEDKRSSIQIVVPPEELAAFVQEQKEK